MSMLLRVFRNDWEGGALQEGRSSGCDEPLHGNVSSFFPVTNVTNTERYHLYLTNCWKLEGLWGNVSFRMCLILSFFPRHLLLSAGRFKYWANWKFGLTQHGSAQRLKFLSSC